MKFRLFFAVFLIGSTSMAWSQFPEVKTDLDRKVKAFLDSNSRNWRDLNIPLVDGKVLYDLIVENNYKSAVEIGTSTGHSAIWIALALSKTGGKLITIEIDGSRYQKAKENIELAGLSDYVDLRHGNAHQLVPALNGKYDFVFSDADKDWYKNYFVAMDSKLVVGGTFAAHNVAQRTRDIREFLDYIESLSNYKTTIDRTSREGISISRKISEK